MQLESYVTLQTYRQAFIAVEKGYLDSVDDRLSERTSLQYEIPDGMTSYQAYQKFPHLVCMKGYQSQNTHVHMYVKTTKYTNTSILTFRRQSVHALPLV